MPDIEQGKIQPQDNTVSVRDALKLGGATTLTAAVVLAGKEAKGKFSLVRKLFDSMTHEWPINDFLTGLRQELALKQEPLTEDHDEETGSNLLSFAFGGKHYQFKNISDHDRTPLLTLLTGSNVDPDILYSGGIGVILLLLNGKKITRRQFLIGAGATSGLVLTGGLITSCTAQAATRERPTESTYDLLMTATDVNSGVYTPTPNTTDIHGRTTVTSTPTKQIIITPSPTATRTPPETPTLTITPTEIPIPEVEFTNLLWSLDFSQDGWIRNNLKIAGEVGWEIIDDPTNSGRGQVLKGVIHGEPFNQGSNYAYRLYPGYNGWVAGQVRFDEDVYVTEELLHPVRWFTHHNFFDYSKYDGGKWHALIISTYDKGKYGGHIILGLDTGNGKTDIRPQPVLGAPKFTPNEWHRMSTQVLKTEEGWSAYLFQDEQLVVFHPLPTSARMNDKGEPIFVSFHGGPIYAGAVDLEKARIPKDAYAMVANTAIWI